MIRRWCFWSVGAVDLFGTVAQKVFSQPTLRFLWLIPMDGIHATHPRTPKEGVDSPANTNKRYVFSHDFLNRGAVSDFDFNPSTVFSLTVRALLFPRRHQLFRLHAGEFLIAASLLAEHGGPRSGTRWTPGRSGDANVHRGASLFGFKRDHHLGGSDSKDETTNLFIWGSRLVHLLSLGSGFASHASQQNCLGPNGRIPFFSLTRQEDWQSVNKGGSRWF